MNKKEYYKMQQSMAHAMQEEKNSNKNDQVHYENFFATKKPMPLS